MKILISKINQIGDMSFVLPLATLIKRHHPNWKVYFLGQSFNKCLIDYYADADGFVDWTVLQQLTTEEKITYLKNFYFDAILHIHPNKTVAKLAKQSKIPLRVGTRNRFFHWWYCNRLITLSRKKSDLHEAQLDCFFLKALKLPYQYTLAELAACYHYKNIPLLPKAAAFLEANKFNLIIHPLTRGRHIEWPLKHYAQLIQKLSPDNFNIIITGKLDEAEEIEKNLLSAVKQLPHIKSSVGKLNLAELLSLIHHTQGLVASSTGPIHLAATAGINTWGLYAPIKPFDAGRWGPIGKRVKVFSLAGPCDWCRDCRRCRCVGEITVEQIYQSILQANVSLSHEQMND